MSTKEWSPPRWNLGLSLRFARSNEIVWEADPETLADQRIDGTITYGVPPKNWRNNRTPAALICGKAYLLNPGAKFFALKCDGTVVVFEFQHLDEFFGQTAPPR